MRDPIISRTVDNLNTADQVGPARQCNYCRE
jgi:hypothetical protein